MASVREGPGWPALVDRAWDLSDLEERYEAFYSEFSRYMGPKASPGDREAFQVRTRMTHVFRAFASSTPSSQTSSSRCRMRAGGRPTCSRPYTRRWRRPRSGTSTR